MTFPYYCKELDLSKVIAGVRIRVIFHRKGQRQGKEVKAGEGGEGGGGGRGGGGEQAAKGEEDKEGEEREEGEEGEEGKGPKCPKETNGCLLPLHERPQRRDEGRKPGPQDW